MDMQWLLLGDDLAKLGLGDAAEAKLSTQARDAMVLARVMRLGGMFPEVDYEDEDEEGATSAAGGRGARVRAKEWQIARLGQELDELGLDEATEGGLNSHAREALAHQREVRLAMAEAGGDLHEGGEAVMSKSGRAKKRKEWLALGEELVMLGMDEEAEAGLSEQVRSAMAIARAMMKRQTTLEALEHAEANERKAQKAKKGQYTKVPLGLPPTAIGGHGLGEQIEAEVHTPKRGTRLHNKPSVGRHHHSTEGQNPTGRV